MGQRLVNSLRMEICGMEHGLREKKRLGLTDTGFLEGAVYAYKQWVDHEERQLERQRAVQKVQ